MKPGDMLTTLDNLAPRGFGHGGLDLDRYTSDMPKGEPEARDSVRAEQRDARLGGDAMSAICARLEANSICAGLSAMMPREVGCARRL